MSKTNRREFLINSAPVAAAALLLPTFARDAVAVPNWHAAFDDGTQRDWRYCDKCFNLFYDGLADKGHCPAGAGHRAQGLNFVLLYGNLPNVPKVQINWRYCDKCHVMFYNGLPGKGRCAAGGAHNAQGFNFRLAHDSTPYDNEQSNWRFCSKCSGMFYDGYPGKGTCPAGSGHLAQGYVFNLPHPAAPVVAAAPAEAHFRQNIVTPSGTALGGFVDLILRSDGTFKAHFHMHDSGEPDYNFTLRAVFAATNGLAFALQHTGGVKGHLFGSGQSDRNDEKDIEGSHPFIKDNWEAVKAGHLAVSKQYKADGLVGFVQDLANVVLDITKSVASGASGAVIGLGDEMKNAFDSLGVGSDFGIIAGVVVFASGGTLVLAEIAGVEVAAATRLLVKHSPLTGPQAGFAAIVFGGSLPPTSQVVLTNLAGLGGRAFTIPSGDKIYCNLGKGFNSPLTYADPLKYPKPGQLFIHELTHAWQIHHRTFVPGWICDGIVAQTKNTLLGSSYKYGAYDGRPWAKYNIEQQGAIVDQWYGRQTVPPGAPDPTDKFFGYIRDNIRAGRT